MFIVQELSLTRGVPVVPSVYLHTYSHTDYFPTYLHRQGLNSRRWAKQTFKPKRFHSIPPQNVLVYANCPKNVSRALTTHYQGMQN